jgi:hypothetical protein
MKDFHYTIKVVKDFLNLNIGNIFLILGFFVGLYLDWSLEETLILVGFIWSVLHPQKSGTYGKIFALTIVAVAFLLIVDRSKEAANLAVISFYTLVLGVVTSIQEYKNNLKLHS